MALTITKQGIKQIVLEGYKYSFLRMNGKSLARWRCVKQRKGCRALLVTVDGEIVQHKHSHNHPP
uniref:SFRICE_004113 n=1 Tax=Spodoptera frugiperda TaxID=7108 RepID=A0A2H1VN69_SPOFR